MQVSNQRPSTTEAHPISNSKRTELLRMLEDIDCVELSLNAEHVIMRA
jgi:hypothetical protein